VGGPFPVKYASLFLGNAGTAFRSLTAACAFAHGDYTMSGVPRMHERPIGDLVEALRQAGANIDYTENDGFPPLHILPPAPNGGEIAVKGNVSSQFLTGLLLAAPLLGRAVTIRVVGELISKPYVEITLNLMQRYGIEVGREGWERFTVPAGTYASPGEILVEGDASSASYFLAAGAVGHGPVRVQGVGRNSIQGDVRFAEALARMGAEVGFGPDWIECRLGCADKLHAIDLDCNHIPDAAMTLAVLALFADGDTTLRNIASWRVKETDRIAAMATELRKLGATVEEGADWLGVSPPLTSPKGAGRHDVAIPSDARDGATRHTFSANAAIDTYDDHRMAMCFSLAALGGVPLRINDPACVAKTFPDYFERYGRIAAPVIAIDGPSASGKGTVAQRVARQLGFHFLDSGALYRLTALAAMRAGVALEDETAVVAVAAELPAEFEGERILLTGDEVTEAIRAEEVGVGASKVAAMPAVRAALLERQRAYRQLPGLVADGRDMGSVVFPEAPVKVFLTASPEARAERRYKQLIEKGMPANMRTLLQDLQERDARDAARAVAPLKQCADAELVDTTSMGIGEAVAAVLEQVKRKLPLQ
jgi:3-phosphoshikimate 1-carboxyvinyltransferase